MTDLSDLIARVERATGADNRLDCEIEIALFEPDETHVSVRMNAAGTKLIYERRNGEKDAYLSGNHTLSSSRRKMTIALLRALDQAERDKSR